MHTARVSDDDAQLIIKMRQLYVGLMPAQRKLLADVVSGVDRTAWEGSARETAAAAHKAARAHAVERVRESGASVAATVLEGETWPAVGEHAAMHVRPPLTLADMKRVLHGGKHSLSAALPKPRVFDLPSGHCVASIADIVAIVLASGADICFINDWAGSDVRHIWQSRVAQRIRKHTVSVHGEHLVLYITEWSDDFENNRYITLAAHTLARSL